MTENKIEESSILRCEEYARQMRIDTIRMTKSTGNHGAHVGGSLSMIEIMAVLYGAVLNYRVDEPRWEERDRFILSKGHGVIAQYTAMKQAGIISEDELMTFKKNSTRLYAHPSMNMDIGIEFSSGSLGQGLSLGVGTALALRRKENNVSRVYILLGDGECDEGSVWEAAESASHYRLDNLMVIIDRNHLQYDGNTDAVMSKGNLVAKWSAFGFKAIEVDGHSVEQLTAALSVKAKTPIAIIADTVKGKGVSFMENEPLWHNGRLSDEQYKIAMSEQGVAL